MFTLFNHSIATLLLAANMGFVYEIHPMQEPIHTAEQVISISLQDTTLKARRSSRYVHSDNNQSTEITYEGSIAFTDDEKDIKSISPGGFFKFSKTTFGNRRAIHIESGSNGELKRTYYVGKNEEPYEPEGRKWMADVLPDLIATTGIGAEDRVKRIYSKNGLNGVLAAVEELESDYVKSIYLGYLLGQNGLKDSESQRILTAIDEEIHSDFEKSKLLRRVSGSALQNTQVSAAYIQAVSNMSSDFEKAKVIQYMLGQNNLSDAHFTRVLQALQEMSSDFEKSKLLMQLLNKPNLSNTHFKQTMNVVAGMSSDFEKSKVISKLLSNHKLLNENFSNTLQVISGIRSDFEKSKVLNQLFTHTKMAGEQFNQALQAVSSISSDFEKSKTFTALLNSSKLTEAQYIQTLQGVANISSDFEKSKVLRLIGKDLPKDKAAVVEAYRKAAKTIRSDHEYGQVMRSIE